MNYKNKTIKNVPQDLWDELKKQAIDEHIGVSALIIKILRQGCKGKEREK